MAHSLTAEQANPSVGSCNCKRNGNRRTTHSNMGEELSHAMTHSRPLESHVVKCHVVVSFIATPTMDADNDYSRNTGHDSNAFWNATGRRLFDLVMHEYIKFDDIGLDDLVGDNSIVLFTEFVNRCCRNPPVSNHTKKPFEATTLMSTLSTCIRKLKEKFRGQTENLPALVPEDMEKQWRKKLKDNHNRTMMQGEDESEVLKSVLPLPRKVGVRTRVFPGDDVPENVRAQAEQVDLLSMARKLFSANRFTELCSDLTNTERSCISFLILRFSCTMSSFSAFSFFT